MNTTTNRRSPIRTITVTFDSTDHQVTAVPMTDADLTAHAEDIDILDLPGDATGMQPLKGHHLYNARGEHFGRVFARAGRMTAEWYDDTEQNDWLLASDDCHRLERAVIEILRLRDETQRRFAAASAQGRAATARKRADEEARYRAMFTDHRVA